MNTTLFLLPGVGLCLLTVWNLFNRYTFIPIPGVFEEGWIIEENDMPRIFWFLTTLYGSAGVTFLVLFAVGIMPGSPK